MFFGSIQYWGSRRETANHIGIKRKLNTAGKQDQNGSHAAVPRASKYIR